MDVPFFNYFAMVDLVLYNYNGERNKVKKTLGESQTVQGEINNEFDILAPVVRFRSNVPLQHNYACLPSLGNRYYFVDSLVQKGNVCTIHLKLDVLYTYKDKILSGEGTLVKGETGIVNAFASNRNNVYDVRPNLAKYDFSNDVSFEDKGEIVMVTIKGNK